MWRLKGCPRCGGDMYIERGINGWNEQCLQCGYMSECNTRPKMEKEAILAGARRTLANSPVSDVVSRGS